MSKNNIAKNLATIKPPEPTSPIKLSMEQAEAVKAAEQHVVDLKCKLANLTIKQLQASQDTVRAEQALIDKISELARMSGITIEEAGKWNFDTKEMTFTKVNR